MSTPLLAQANLQSLYRTLFLIRQVEERLADSVIKGEVKTPCHLYIGQEAVAVGVCAHLKKNDYAFGTHRSHGHYLAKGGSLNKLIAEIFGKETGCSKGRGGSMHLIAPECGFLGAQPIVSGTVSFAMGTALASFIQSKNLVSVAFFGDGAMEEGIVHECLNFSALKKLKILFVCENNFYSSHLRINERRLKNNLSKEASTHGIPSLQIDGQDVTKVYEATRKMISFMRAKQTPGFIEARTYRFRGHVGAIDYIKDVHVTDIRNEKEVRKWLKRDPITIAKRKLIKNGITLHAIEALEKKVTQQVDVAFSYAHKSPYPQAASLLDYVFRT